MASSLEKYPYPSEFNVGDFVPDKLSDRNYKQWKELMVDFIESRGLLGFIHGEVKAPSKTITVVKSDVGGGGVSDSGGGTNSKEIENEEYKLWKRLDALVRGWILTTLTKYILTRVLSLKTAEEVWKRLEQMFNLAKLIEIDIALTVLRDYPELACMEGPSPLMDIAGKVSSFRSRTPLNFWQKLIYTHVPMKLENTADHQRGGDIENHADFFISSLHFVKQRLHAMFWKVAEKIVPQMKYIREKKLIHHQSLELVKFICMKVANSNFKKAVGIFHPVLLKATSIGIHEIVEEILESFPAGINFPNPNYQTVFQFAIVCRRENVFNLIYQCDDPSHSILSNWDALGNNGLHLAGCLGPEQQLNLRKSAAGAVLQMQQELQWFKEVKNFAPPGDNEIRNADGMTPAEVFTITHKELVKEGERWMKETTNSFTIVATLIGTMVFAAAITVPGGNNDKSGHPYFFKQNAFIIFAVSNALAFFSSVIFVVMFLSILTSRYAEEDFLYSLPNKLIIGLATLFVSISFTMIAFGAILYLVFGDNRTWILTPIVALASLPLILFVYLQLPLFVEMVKSTYGGGIFGKQSDRMLL